MLNLQQPLEDLQRKCATGEITTQDGRAVRIYALDGASTYPIHGAVSFDGGWLSDCWQRDGRCATSGVGKAYNLIEASPKRSTQYWLRHYSDHNDEIVYSESSAKRIHPDYPKPIAITGPHTVTFRKGDGLP